MTKIILDCDPGVDDTMALMYAALHPDIELLAVGTVWGNVEVEMGTRNAIHTLEMVGAGHVPVAQGAAKTLLGEAQEYAYFVHGDDGQGNQYDDAPVGPAAPVTAAQQIVDVVRAHPGEVWIVTVGPLTNVATALVLEPDLPSMVAGVSIMGGTVRTPGNVSPVAEANIWHDPEAASVVFNAPWPITMSGLDITLGVRIGPERRKVLDAGGKAAQYMSRILQFYGDYNAQTFGSWTATMHDTIGVAAAAGALIVNESHLVKVEVDCSNGPSRGATIADLRDVYAGRPPQPGANTTLLLDIEDSIADDVVALIASYRSDDEAPATAD